MSVEISIGVPSDPLPEDIVEEIAAVIRKIPNIAFAFMPEMFIPGQMDAPATVLVLVTKLDGRKLNRTIQRLREKIVAIMPDGLILDMLPLNPDHELIAPTIETGCLVEVNDHELFEICQSSI